MKAAVFGLDGKAVKEVELPPQFSETYRPDVINRAFLAENSLKFQPKGNFILSGMQTSAEYYGRRHAWRQTINTGRSRLPREKIAKGRSGKVRMVPHSVKGRRAHPPKPWKKIAERINAKEMNLAMRSAVAATANAGAVGARGHAFDGRKLPIVVDDSIQRVKKVSEAKQVLSSIGLEKDLERARERRRMRSGRSRLRKGGHSTPKSVLIVVAKDEGIWRAARNIPGVEVVEVKKLRAEHLAPGGSAGRLSAWTEGALALMGREKLFY
ncbi:MAG: 50S ribosomal protein L4 [Candidatus Micrarchaeota archaeon]|nr:50S ribosomal protein L4 [Candidatus Micrarchaeota archaeon]